VPEAAGRSGTGHGGGASGVKQLADILANVAVGEDRVSGDEEIGARANHIRNGVEIDAAIDFDAERQAAGFANTRQRFDLTKRAGDKFLRAKTGIHRHHENVVDDVQDLVEGVDRCCGIDDHGGFAAVRSDQVKCAIQMDAGFLMDGHPIGASIGKCGDEVVGIFNHQVAIEGHTWDGFAQGGNDRRADGDVRNKMAIHDVDVEDRAAGVDGGLCLRAELSEVGGENRGCEFDQGALLEGDSALQ
jgi:hypothetical protein